MAEIKKEYITGAQKNLKRVVFKLSEGDKHTLPITAEEYVREFSGVDVIVYDISDGQSAACQMTPMFESAEDVVRCNPIPSALVSLHLIAGSSNMAGLSVRFTEVTTNG